MSRSRSEATMLIAVMLTITALIWIAMAHNPAPAHVAVTCQEDQPCWIPALDGNGRGQIPLSDPLVGH